MGRVIIVEPMAIAAIAASRGTGAANLMTPDPKEVWADSETSSYALLNVDLGAVRTFDTVMLGSVRPPASFAVWSLAIGTAGYDETVLQDDQALRVPDAPGEFPDLSHALWHGAPATARYLSIRVAQPFGWPTLTAGVLVVGKAFVAELGQDWGAGRRPIDTGTATPLASGGFSVVEGARKSAFSWTFSDLSIAEADQLDAIAGRLGSTKPVLVVEDPEPTPGLRQRVHYGLFARWRQYERRNRRQTRWEVEIEQWT